MSDNYRIRKTAITDQNWPALATPRGAQLEALLFQFAHSEWLPPASLLERQMIQAKRLLTYARDTVPWYREHLAGVELNAQAVLDLDAWRRLPILTRAEVQSAGALLHSTRVPAAFGAVHKTATSGSTGEPVHLLGTRLDTLFWEAMTLREHAWHRRDFGAKLASIRVFGSGIASGPHGAEHPHWGGPASALYTTGPLVMLALDTDIADQVSWLMRHQPDYLVTYPTNLAALLDEAAAGRLHLTALREVRTVGETVSGELRERCRQGLGVALTDVYSSREVGYIALQCPESGHYHVTSESVLVELLDAAGAPVAPGHSGRLVVTPLHNYASPLIRYALNDYAEAGAPCPCGRGLPTLTRILGRQRNMVMLPDGRRYWPMVGFGEYREIAPIRQYQLVQTSFSDITVNLVVDRALDAREEERLSNVIRAALRHPFDLHFNYVRGQIARGPGGKYEEFVSQLSLPHAAGNDPSGGGAIAERGL